MMMQFTGTNTSALQQFEPDIAAFLLIRCAHFCSDVHNFETLIVHSNSSICPGATTLCLGMVGLVATETTRGQQCWTGILACR
jgi:hypothetical protein